MTTESTPRGNAPTSTAAGTATALLIAVAVAAAACGLAALLAPPSLRAEITWAAAGCGVLLCTAVATAAHQRLTVRRLRGVIAEQRDEAEAARAAAAHFADVTVPEVVLRLRRGASADTALASVTQAGDETQRRVLRTLAAEVHRGESRRAAAMTACANAAGRVQALTTSMAADLREMEHRHADPDVLADLLHLDHRTAQAGRLADSIAVLTGARSGRRWAKPIRMESILRGAMGRIQGYQRVRLHSTSTVSVAGHAAEGVMHALAEIMDNAANFSPPTAEVHVYVEEVSAGVVVTVEDGGLVMGEEALRRARDAVEPRSARDLSALPGTRLGLSVVGRLAHKHGLTVAFRPSAHGGTGVLLRLPPELIASEPSARDDAPAVCLPTPEKPRPEAVQNRSTPHEAPAVAAAGDDTPEHVRDPQTADDDAREHRRVRDTTPDGEAVEYGESGLPRRRRGRTLAAAQGDAESATPRRRTTRSAAESASRLGAFRRAVRARPQEDPASPKNPRTADSVPPVPPDTAASRPEDHT